MANANWSNPTLTSTYTNFVSEVKNRDEDLALQFDGTTSTNIPTNTIRWDSGANRWKKWNGTTWAELATTYALTGLSTTGAASIGTTLGVTGVTTLTGGGTSTTSAVDNNSTNIATTAFVVGQAAGTAPVMNGTAAVGTSLRYARQDHVHPSDTSRAPLASPTFTGTVTIPAGASISGYAPLASPTFTGTVTIPAGASISGYLTTASASSTYAPIASPTFTGTPAVPTAGSGTNTTQIASTAFVTSAISSFANFVTATRVASTSGVSIDFTSLPSYVKRIVLMFNGVSTSGANDYLIQIGDSSGFASTGYLGASSIYGGATTNFTTGFGISSSLGANIHHGIIILNTLGSNIWVASGTVARSNTATMVSTAGSKTLTGTLDRLRITTTTAVDTFDAGSININYEG